MKIHRNIRYMAVLSGILLSLSVNSATFPLIIDFEDSQQGTDAPVGWRHGPPAGSKSIGMPWSVAQSADWGNVYQFSGAGQFDGAGRAYATIPVDNVPHGDGTNWKFSVDFKLVDFLMDGPMDSFRFGLGVLGLNTMFASASAGGFGGNDFYLIDWGFTLPEEIRQLDGVSMTYRFVEFGALGAVEIGFYSQHIATGFFNTNDSFRMVVEGRYEGTNLNFLSWVQNLSQGTTTEPVSAVASNPFQGRNFGLRFQSGAGVTTVSPPSANALGELTIHLDNVRLTDVDDTDTAPHQFWSNFADAGDGWKEGWLGYLQPASGAYAYHLGLKWIYSASPESTSCWIYLLQNPQFGWFWTSEVFYPYIWSPTHGWCYLLQPQSTVPYIYFLETGESTRAVEGD